MNFLPRAEAAAVAATTVLVFAACLLLSGCGRDQNSAASPPTDPPTNASGPPVIELSGDQLNSIKIGTVGTYSFSVEKAGIGNIDFQDDLYSDSSLSHQIFPPEAGTLSQMLVELGDQVQKGQALYSIQTDSTNIVVRSPISGQVTAVNASPGTSVEPGKDPAPCAVAEVSTKWLLASVPESDSPFFQPGQPVKVSVEAYPGLSFDGKVIKIYPDVDINTHRTTVRCEIPDKANVLRAGMLADFSIRVQKPVESVAIPANGVVREGDGTMTAWVTTDRSHFVQRDIKIGLQNDGMDQVLNGLRPGELAVTDGAIFIDNMLQAPPDDD
ncbi:MAG TPA: efflux RND transporter periplasmic adaptor subunit [Candidatus Acidoferrales bacterium]|jgi:multidrug efflux pump subunit AcrA (membrane-fusion protein)|nr:efflux RND transporter periplasmic adaptor subunit [Candidatus Acidoferrales bacterium]